MHAGASVFSAAEVTTQDQGLRCAIASDMSATEIDPRDMHGSFQLPPLLKRESRQSLCCRVPALAVIPNGTPDPDAFGLHCMPSFIIAGAQKSGTTFLAAALTQHPQIVFSSRKELHYFNNEAHYAKGLRDGYLRSFAAWNWTDPRWKYGPPMYVQIDTKCCVLLMRYLPHRALTHLASTLISHSDMAKLRPHTSPTARHVLGFIAVSVNTPAWCCSCVSP